MQNITPDDTRGDHYIKNGSVQMPELWIQEHKGNPTMWRTSETMNQIQQVTNFDGEYTGAMAGTFDLDEPAKQILGEPKPSDVFAYMFRRFGYPRFGWDDYKTLVQYYITTGLDGVVLMVRPAFAGGETFGYVLRKDIDKACMEEDRKPYTELYERFEAWAIETKGVETMHEYYEPDLDKLNRVWQAWIKKHEPNDFKTQEDAEMVFFAEQANITNDLLAEYSKIEPQPKQVLLEDRPDDSIMKQCYNSLCAAIKDLLQLVHVRDAAINVCGKVRGDVECVAYSSMAGRGVGSQFDDILNKDSQ